MQLQALTRRGRGTALALAAVLVAGSCSVFGEEPLAVVPPLAGGQETRSARQDGRATRVDRAAARAARRSPRPTPQVEEPPETEPSGAPVVTAAPDASATPEHRAAPEPDVTVIRLKPRPVPGPFSMNLYRRGDFSHQATKDWCVAGSTQTMMNIMRRGRNDHSVTSQRRLYENGRRFSPVKRKLGPIGVDLIGWATLLERGGFGPYVVEGAGTRRAAIRKAARALRITGRPVGLATWRGAHSWVMSGFTATADPAWRDDYEVTAVYIQDTWYPWVSSIWGASRPPNSLVPVAALAEDYLPYRRPLARWPSRDGRFMLVLPELPADTVAR